MERLDLMTLENAEEAEDNNEAVEPNGQDLPTASTPGSPRAMSSASPDTAGQTPLSWVAADEDVGEPVGERGSEPSRERNGMSQPLLMCRHRAYSLVKLDMCSQTMPWVHPFWKLTFHLPSRAFCRIFSLNFRRLNK